MLGRTYENEVCSIARALEVAGERWSLLILRNALFAGARRYSDFQRSLGLASNVLQSRLDGFVDAGLMQRHPQPGQAAAYEYQLTEKGRGFALALIALTEWGDRFAAPDGPPVLYRHADCGSAVHAQLVCETCGVLHSPPASETGEASVAEEAAVAPAVQAHPGPGMPAERAARMTARLS